MFKRSLNPEAFDQISFEKKENSPSSNVMQSEDASFSDFSKWFSYIKLIAHYERPIYWIFSTLFYALLILIHWQYQDGVDAQLKNHKEQLLRHHLEINAIKIDRTNWHPDLSKDSEFTSSLDERLESNEVVPEITYLGSFKQGAVRQGLISYGHSSEDQHHSEQKFQSKTQWVWVGQPIEFVGTVKAIEDRYLTIESNRGKVIKVWVEGQP